MPSASDLSAASPQAAVTPPVWPTASEAAWREAIEGVQVALSLYLSRRRVEARSSLQDAVRVTAHLAAGLPRSQAKSELTQSVLSLVRELDASGVRDHPVDPADLARVQSWAPLGWPGVLAAMVLVPARAWPQAPALGTLPDWLWVDYASWLLAPPHRFTALGQAAAFPAYLLPRLEEIANWADRARGSATVRAVLDAYVRHYSGVHLYFHDGNLRRHAELHGRILARALRPLQDDFPPEAYPCHGRRLRVGFINRHFSPQTESYTTLPSFEHLDPERFEVRLFAFHDRGTPLEAYCRSRAASFELLPTQHLAGQLDILRAAQLDVVVFGTNLTTMFHEVQRLALHRIAPLQVVNNSSCITTGLPEIDLYVSGTLTEVADAASQFSERLGLLPGPAHAFNYEVDRQEPTTTWTRAALGLPEDAVVFVSAANFYKLIPEMQHTWARLLAETPGSYLLVHPFNPNWSETYPMEQFCAECDQVFSAHGIEGHRLIVSNTCFPSRADVKALLSIGDIYLDTYPFGGVNSMVDPLELGLPVVAWSGQTFRSRMGGALLHSLGCAELVTTDEAGYRALAQRLATDPAYRAEVRQRIEAAMAQTPLFLDQLAASDAFGDLLERAYDELATVGLGAFRRARTPLLAAPPEVDPEKAVQAAAAALASGDPYTAGLQARDALRCVPHHAEARQLLGRALLAQGKPGRAAVYLVAALAGSAPDASLWFDAATALRLSRQPRQAIEALEAGLYLDPSRTEAWAALAELAENAGAHDLAREARDVIRQLTPAQAAPEDAPVLI